MKLLSVERSLTIFHRKNNELVAEYPIQLELDVLKVIVKGIKHDELLYRTYSLNKSQTKKLMTNVNLDLMIEMKTYRYFLDCTGIYE